MRCAASDPRAPAYLLAFRDLGRHPQRCPPPHQASFSLDTPEDVLAPSGGDIGRSFKTAFRIEEIGVRGRSLIPGIRGDWTEVVP